jgi:hypothetical protein
MDRILWNSMTIQVPTECVHYTPGGRVSIKKTLTRLHGISRSARIPSINLVASPDNKVHVVSQGNTYNVDDLRRRVQAGEQIHHRINPQVKGYSWNNQKQKWQARIKVNQRIRHLGFFDNEEDAHQAYLKAKRELE